jgi:Ca2+-binding RTX toxin-like protein
MRGAGVRSAVGLAATVVALLASPATGQASIQFGSNLAGGTPAILVCAATCTQWSTALPAENTAGTLTSPADGVITTFSVNSATTNLDDAWAPVHLRVIRALNGGQTWSGLGISTPDVTPNAAGVQTFPARVPIGAGDYIGLETPGGGSIRAGAQLSGGSLDLLVGDTFPSNGSGIPADSNIPGVGLLLRATLEPDADRDGFGDETQDRSKGGPKQPAACSPSRATIVGTNGPDVLTGTQGRDVILGLSGRDRVRGLGGADVICGHDGKDLINGGPGRDRLVGGAGSDREIGGAGRDRCTVFDPRC